MATACHEVAVEAGWRLRTLLRSRRFHDVGNLICMFKSHLLPLIESSTPAIFHAAESHLAVLDRIQDRFLREIDMSKETALLHFNLAPLRCRRNIAMLELIHRTSLGRGPHFRRWFFPREEAQHAPTRLSVRRHPRQLHDFVKGNHTDYLARSALGMVRVYNALPCFIVEQTSVKEIQHELQNMLKRSAEEQREDWLFIFPCR